jgi:hypothetical protein
MTRRLPLTPRPAGLTDEQAVALSLIRGFGTGIPIFFQAPFRREADLFDWIKRVAAGEAEPADAAELARLRRGLDRIIRVIRG